MTDEPFLRGLMSDVVGSGPRSASDMSYEQAREAFDRILAGDADPVTLGGFWTANRWKRNTPVELAAFVDAMRESSVETGAPDADPVDCGANYDGKTETAVLGVAAGVVAAAAGTPVVTHSADRVPTKRGVAYRHVLDELGVRTDLGPAASAAMVDETGFGFYYAPRFNPGVRALLDSREALGVRTFVNTVETLANPADADVHLGSFFHLSFADKVVQALRESRTAAVDRVVMFQGQEGYDDVRTGTTRVAEWDGGDHADANGGEDDENVVETYEVETAEFGVEEDVVASDDDPATASARLTREVVSRERNDAATDAVALNAGFRIYARDDARTLDAAVERARDAIADGSAAEVLGSLQRFERAGDES
jgi:anthranilate phosphoribosyltransferase